MKAPLQEFSAAYAVVFEVPPLVTQRFEHYMLNLVQKVRALGLEVAIIVRAAQFEETHQQNSLDL